MLRLDPLANDELVQFLEPEQLVSDTAQPVPRAVLTAPVRATLWVLRIFTVLLATAVVYTFVSELLR